MKNLLLLTVFILIGSFTTHAQGTSNLQGDPTLPPGQYAASGQTTLRAGDFFIFGYSGGASSAFLELNGVEIPSITQGWYLDNGNHSATNSNYLCGFYYNQYYRNFMAFDLANLNNYGITPPITSATLKVVKASSIPATGFAVWDLYHVSTPWSTINTNYNYGDPTGLAIFSDLGTGSYYGNGTVDGSLPSTAIIATTLNTAAVTDINASVGSVFVIGGRSDDYLTNAPPTAVTNAATSVTSNSATLNGEVNANGLPTTVTFLYGTSSGNLNQTVNAVPNSVTGTTSTPVSANISGLTPGVTYYFQVKTENSQGAIVYGAEMEFTTSSGPLPVPLSNWAIYFGIFLIGLFVMARYRRKMA